MHTTGQFTEQTHPDAGMLRDFVNGRLDEQQSREVELHLEECPSCCDALARNSSEADAFVHKLVSAVATSHLASSARVGETPAPALARGSTPLAATADTATYRAPQTVGRFEIRGQIGHGGFGIVLAGYDPNLRRDVAVKIPRSGSFLTAEMRDRFQREAQAAAALNHQHILPIYEAGEDGTLCYIATAYCRGPNLSQWLKAQGEPVPVRTAAWLVAALADAIHHAHRRGVLHRDLKPSNVLLEPLEEPTERKNDTELKNGKVPIGRQPGASGDLSPFSPSLAAAANKFGFVPKITDFGLAKLASDGSDTTHSNVVMGTASYMAPEQASGKAKAVGPQVDIYALGAILYELLTGRPPLVGETDLDTLQRVQHEEPILPAKLRPKLPTDLQTICLTCLHKDPGRRYPSAEALADDLQGFLRGEPIRARPVSRLEHAWRWCRRKPALAALSMAVAVLLVALVAGSVLSAAWVGKEQTATLAQLKKTQQAEAKALEQQAEAERQLFASLVAQARARRLSGHVGQRFAGMQALVEAAELARTLQLGPEETLALRNELIACLALTDLRVDKTWEGYPPGSAATGIAFDVSLQRYAIIDADGHLLVRRMEVNQELARIDLDPPRGRRPDWRLLLYFSPDGKYVAARGDQLGSYQIPTRVWNWEVGELVLTVPHEAIRHGCHLNFSPDSRLFALGLADGSIGLYDLASGTQRKRVGAGSPAHAIRFDPSGEKLAVCRGDEVQIVEWETNKTVGQLKHPGGLNMACWSPNGRLLAAACRDRQAYIWDAASGKRLVACTGHQAEIVHVSFNDRGDQLATASYDGTTRIWDVATGMQLLIERGAGGDFSRDGRGLAFGSVGSTVGRWEVARSDVFQSFEDHGATYGLAIDPSGRLLAAGRNDRLLFWNMATGKQVGALQIGSTNFRVVPGFHTSQDCLVTFSAAGVQRWPIERKDEGRTMRIGPPAPVRFATEANPKGFRFGASDHLLAWDNSELWTGKLNGDRAEQLAARPFHPGLWYPDASPDGRWLATAAWQGFETRVWDAQSGKLVHEFPGRSARVAFSPDNEHLLISTPDGYSLHRVGTWELVRRIERVDTGGEVPMAFSRDGRLLAIAPSQTVKLLEFPSCRELASLSSPVPETINHLRFSPDADRLVVESFSGSLRAWDLRQIRDHLAKMGLDWDTPAYPPGQSLESLTLDIDPGEFLDVERLSAAIARGPNDAELYFQRGLANRRLRQLQPAAGDFRKAIELKPEHAEALFERGWIHAEHGRTSDAIKDFTQAVARRPEFADAYRQRARAHRRENNWRAALDDFSRASALQPESADLLHASGLMHHRLKEWTEAEVALSRAIALGADARRLADIHTSRAHVYRQLGRFHDSIDDYEKAYKLDPEYHNRGNNLAWALVVCPDREFHDADRAVELARRAVRTTPEDDDPWNTLGVAYYRQGQWDATLAAFDESMNLGGGGDSWDWFFIAMCRWQRGEKDEARRWFHKAVEWAQGNMPDEIEFKWFRAEAEELMQESTSAAN